MLVDAVGVGGINFQGNLVDHVLALTVQSILVAIDFLTPLSRQPNTILGFRKTTIA